MIGEKVNQQAINNDSPKSSETVLATKSGYPAKRSSVSRWKQLHLKSSIILMLLGALAIIVYVLRSGIAKQYEGLGAALCAAACGVFLVWHTIHLFAEQNVLEEQQLNLDQPKVSPPETNPDELQTNLTTPPKEAGGNS